MDVMALDQDGIQSFPPSTLPSSTLEGFQAISSQHTLLDMDLTGSFDLRPPISSSSQPSLGLTGFMDTLTLPQLSEMTRTQYQNLKDTTLWNQWLILWISYKRLLINILNK